MLASRLMVHAFVLVLIANVHAFPRYKALIPNGEAHSRPDSGITCEQLGHTPCAPGEPRNAFGLAFAAAGRKWTKGLCNADSDGDGLTNGEELGDPCCEWSEDNPTQLRLTMLSHPGVESEDGAKDAPKCTTAPPTTTTVTTTSTTAAPDTTTTTAAPGTATTTAAPDATTTTAAPTTTAGTTTTTTGANASPSSSPDDDDGVCFPAHATVSLTDGSVKRMADLNIGDRVQVGADVFSEVFMFTHRLRDVVHEFITIRTGKDGAVEATLTLTGGHFLYVNGGLAPAKDVVIGDELELVSGKKSRVFDVSCSVYKGLYNPQTEHGDLIVDSVKVSTYTTAVEIGMAHSLLAPFRMLYRFVGWTTSALEAGADRIVALLP